MNLLKTPLKILKMLKNLKSLKSQKETFAVMSVGNSAKLKSI